MKQLELIHRKVLWTYPAPMRTARTPLRARVDDGLDYMLKDDSNGLPIRAREWLCHGLAEKAGLPVAEYRSILLPPDKILFGSRIVLSGSPGGLALTAGVLPLAEAKGVLSAIYAVDLFLNNWDRHVNNLLLEPDTTGPRIRVIDFSEAACLLDPAERLNIPGPASATVRIGRLLRGFYGFDLTAASLALDRLEAVTVQQIRQILDDMHGDWLTQDRRDELCSWWAAASRSTRIKTVRNGLTNGSLL